MKFVRRRGDWLLIALAASCLLLAYVFAKFGSEVLEGELATMDIIVRQWVLEHHTAFGTTLFRGITLLGAKELLVPLGVLIGWRIFRHTRGWLLILIFCALATTEFVAVLKRSFHVWRPAGGVAASMGFSFPSGHTAGAAALWLFLAYLAIRKGLAPGIVATVASFIIFLVGVSRIYLDMHWASDVLGGWVIGAAFGVGCCALWELLQRHQRDDAPSTSEPSGAALSRS